MAHALCDPLERRRRLHRLPATEDRPAFRPAFDRDGTPRWLSPARGRVMQRIPLRLRLTLAFSAAMAVVLGAMAFFVYVGVGRALLRSVDQTLQATANETRDQIRSARGQPTANRPLVDTDSANGLTLAELISASGPGSHA